MSIPLPVDDKARIERLRTLCPDLAGDRVDNALQGLVELAAAACSTPTALVTLVGADTQYFRARKGFGASKTSREVSFCTWAIMDDAPFVVPDALVDDRFRWNPLVTGDPHIRFYAGVPLTTSDGVHNLGTVCVIDKEPRELDTAQLEMLGGVARSVVNIIEQEFELVSSALRAERMLDSIADGVVATDTAGILTYANPAAMAFLGPGIIGESAVDSVRLEVDGALLEEHPIQSVLRTHDSASIPASTRLNLPDGSAIEIDTRVAPTLDLRDDLAGAMMVFRNVTAERMASRALAWQGTHDALTGLANRPAFEQRLADRLRSGPMPPASVLFVDLDRFKGVNDELGHAVGDQLLAQVASLLASSVRSGDVVARIGGDEFGVLLEDCDQESAQRIGTSLLESLRTLRSAFADRRANINASIGQVSLDRIDLTVEETLRRADTACYAAKHAGGGRVQLYDPKISEIEAWDVSVRWMRILQAAIAENRLRLHAQIIMPMDSDELPALEVLVRLVENEELVRPDAFMAAAERFRLSKLLDHWVVDETLRVLEAAGDVAERFSAVHVNLSGQSLSDVEMARQLRATIEESAVPHGLLCFEITESNAVAELARASEFIEELTAIGCEFALDDFGRGFSSFDYLRRFDVSVVKIDGAFVQDLSNDPVSQEVLGAIVAICGALDKRAIAEWVDSDETINLLRELGVDGVQGNHIAEPLPIETYLART